MHPWGPRDWYADVRQFMKEMDQERPRTPSIPSEAVVELRKKLMREELQETIEAMDAQHIPGIADGLADLIYVVIGASIAYGIDLRTVFQEVHFANMRKTTGPVREDGKRLKPEGWVGPDIEAVLCKQGWNAGE